MRTSSSMPFRGTRKRSAAQIAAESDALADTWMPLPGGTVGYTKVLDQHVTAHLNL
jgi:hypothetical protein